MNSASNYIVFGAGRLGRRVARCLHPVAFCDNNSALWGGIIEGAPVLSPAEAVRRFPETTFVVAIWHPSGSEHIISRIDQLRHLGADRVVPFTEFFDDHADLLPNFFWEKRSYFERYGEQIAAASAVLDEEGKEVLAQQVQLRLGNLNPLKLEDGDQYFPSNLIQLSEDEVFVDCGAYNGDTVSDFLRACNGKFSRIFAFEPDPDNRNQLERVVGEDRRVVVYPYATGARRETLSFATDGSASHLAENGGVCVQCVTLDEVLSEVSPTYIKMDIEGSELDTLQGARHVIERSRPKLAVCVYHEPDHLWSIPLMLHALQPDARLTLRSHCADGFECVCYCLPRP